MLCKFIWIHLDRYYLYSFFFLNIYTYIYIYTHYIFIVYLSIYLIWSNLIYLYKNKYLHNYIYIYIYHDFVNIYTYIYTHNICTTTQSFSFNQLSALKSTQLKDSWFPEGAPCHANLLVEREHWDRLHFFGTLWSLSSGEWVLGLQFFKIPSCVTAPCKRSSAVQSESNFVMNQDSENEWHLYFYSSAALLFPKEYTFVYSKYSTFIRCIHSGCWSSVSQSQMKQL